MEHTYQQRPLKSQQSRSFGNRQLKKFVDNRPEATKQTQMIDMIQNSSRSTDIGVMQRQPVIQRDIKIDGNNYDAAEEVINLIETHSERGWDLRWRKGLEWFIMFDYEFENIDDLAVALKEYLKRDYMRMLENERIRWKNEWDNPMEQILDNPEYVCESGCHLANMLTSLTKLHKMPQQSSSPSYFKLLTSKKTINTCMGEREIPGMIVDVILISTGVYIRIEMPPIVWLGEGTEIGFLQIVRSSKMGNEGTTRGDEYFSTLPSINRPEKGVADEKSGWSLDRGEGATNPFYGIGTSNIQTGSNTKSAVMWDNPYSSGISEWFPRFETSVVIKSCEVDGLDGGILATVTWGFNKYANNFQSNVYWIELREETNFSKLARAIAVWDRLKAQNTQRLRELTFLSEEMQNLEVIESQYDLVKSRDLKEYSEIFRNDLEATGYFGKTREETKKVCPSSEFDMSNWNMSSTKKKPKLKSAMKVEKYSKKPDKIAPKKEYKKG